MMVALLSPQSFPQAARDLSVRLPSKPFGELVHPPEPNYARPEYWAAHPAREDAADVVPAGDLEGDRQQQAQVDVFYIHPTTYRGIDYWNQPLADEAVNRWTDESVIARQAAIFNACCRVFAPRYRQATAAAVYAPPELKGIEAYEFAWRDVRAAFDHYMRIDNAGRPFILVGHSQGAAHLERWLRDFPAEHPYRQQLVAVYAVGATFSERVLEREYQIRVCDRPSSTGCLISWNTFERTGDPTTYRLGAQQRNARQFGIAEDAPLVCVNPLSFSLFTTEVAAQGNPGSLPASPGVGVVQTSSDNGKNRSWLELPATVPGVLGARCEAGVLLVDEPPSQGFSIVPLPGGMLHFNDFDLFFDSIRKNAILRAESFTPGS